MKKKYIKPLMEVINFSEDIITVSSDAPMDDQADEVTDTNN